jgi:hypothetical protein
VAVFGNRFDNEPARHHFAEDLASLMAAENKTVSGINRAFRVIAIDNALVDDAGKLIKDYTQLHLQLIDVTLACRSRVDFSFDCSSTSTIVLNHIPGKHRASVSALEPDRIEVYGRREQKLRDLARQVLCGAKKPVRRGNKPWKSFRKRVRNPDVHLPARVVLFWQGRREHDASKALVTNQVWSEVLRMMLGDWRWTGTTTLHRDGKQQLRLGDCRARHVDLVSTAYTS